MSRILIVDDHPVFRAGLAALLTASGHEVVAEAAGATEAVQLADRLRPELVIMDLGLPDGSGVAATGRIVAAVPGVRVIVVTLFDDEGTVRDALGAGASGYVVKDATPSQLLAAVHAVEQGSVVLGPGATITARPAESPASDPFGLTRREHQVADLLVKGLPNRIIAERLGLAGKTVANLVSVILAKVGASDRLEAAAILREQG